MFEFFQNMFIKDKPKRDHSPKGWHQTDAIWQYPITKGGNKQSDCLIENLVDKLPDEDKGKPLMISCPCKRCSPHSM